MKKGEIWSMYNKIHKLKSEGLGVTQIKKRVNLSRDTIYKYLDMNEDEFAAFLENKTFRKKKLDVIDSFILNLLQTYPDIMASQVEDRIKEKYPDIKVHEKTVRNFVNQLREEYKIAKSINKRIYEAVDEMPYGKQAQVDFGQKKVMIQNKNTKVYFFAISLSRSRYKFVEFQTKPFTSLNAIKCFEEAFEYFSGIPDEIVFDQDRVFMVDENYGDLLLTSEFERYCMMRGFKLNPCRKFDPESKGQIENVVKYVKYNFLSHREFLNVYDLNNQALKWLERTGNGKIHQTTKKIPLEEFQKEKKYLKEHIKLDILDTEKDIYKLRKDNIVVFKGNRYRVPKGTYKDKHSVVKLKEEDHILSIFTQEGELLVSHEIPNTKGNLVGNSNHVRDYSEKISKLKEKVINEIGESEITEKFIDKLTEVKGKYVRDQLTLLNKTIAEYGKSKTLAGINYCLENNIISVPDLRNVIVNVFPDKKVEPISNEFDIKSIESSAVNLHSDKRSIEIYSDVMNS